VDIDECLTQPSLVNGEQRLRRAGVDVVDFEDVQIAGADDAMRSAMRMGDPSQPRPAVVCRARLMFHGRPTVLLLEHFGVLQLYLLLGNGLQVFIQFVE
jgi:hypothetical protein